MSKEMKRFINVRSIGKLTGIKICVDRLGNIIPEKKNSNYSSNNNDSIVSEPAEPYQRTLKQFNSFEELNEADAQIKANIAPQQHIANVTQRINEMYKDELKTPMDKNLKFRND